MADVFIAAAAEANARARGLAEALAAFGFKTSAEIPSDAELTKAVEEAKCVVALWPGQTATPPWLAALAALALERKKLVSLELSRAAAPTPFSAAPRIEIGGRGPAAFKVQFEALAAEIDKLAPREEKPPPEKLPEILVKARAALMHKGDDDRRWRLGAVALAVGLLFAVGFGAGRVINATRSGTFLVAPTTDSANATAASAQNAHAGLSLAELETLSWREASARIHEADAQRIKADAERGDAHAQTLACLGHLAGAEGFLASPAAARQACDAASGQGYPAALYLSWVVRRTAPHAAIDEATARARLRAAAELHWLPAQLDYAQLLAGDFRTPLPDQTEAGRLWLQAAERGDAHGQYGYARWLRDSPAGPRDPAAAIPFLDRAASSGLPEAQHMLATLYRDGIGVTRDAIRARALYERAAAQEHAPAMFNLAAMIDAGSDADRSRAAALYRSLSCMRDERQIQPMAQARLRAMREAPTACG